jgi:hypothetical protein
MQSKLQKLQTKCMNKIAFWVQLSGSENHNLQTTQPLGPMDQREVDLSNETHERNQRRLQVALQ